MFAVLVVVAGAAVAWWWLGESEPAFERASEVADEAPPVEIVRVPDSYRIIYREEDRIGDEPQERTVTIEVQRPFLSRVETRFGPPPGERVLAVRAAAFGRYALAGGGEDLPVLAWPPGPAEADLRLDGVLDDAVADGRIEVRERRMVGERACQVYRLGDTLSGGTLESHEQDAEMYVDACVDAAGLLLEELQIVDGAVNNYRIAVEVTEDVDLPDDLFPVDAEVALSPREGGGSVQEVTLDSEPPGPFWVLDRNPEGFEHLGRFIVIPPQPGAFDDPMMRGNVQAGMADVWVRGPDVLILERGGTLEGGAPFQPSPRGREVDLGELGEGEVIADAGHREVRVLLDGGNFVKIVGTLGADELVRVARQLRSVEGSGDIVTLDAEE